MDVKQVYEFVNSISKQAYGDEGITATDLTGLVEMGKLVLASDKTREPWLNTLVDRIGKTIISMRTYTPRDKGIIKNTFEWGAIMQKIYVEPLEAEENPTWTPEDNATVGTYNIAKAKARQKLFGNRTTWEVDLTIPNRQLKSAFLSESAMAAFIDACFMAVENSIAVQSERYAAMAINNFIGEKINAYKNSTDGIHVVNLLQKYNQERGAELTAGKALYDLDFLKFFTQEIALTLDYMRNMSKLFNTEGYLRHTPRDLARVSILSSVANSAKMWLQSDTFNAEMVALPYYTEVDYWQGSGQEFGFAETSKIDITTSDGNVIQQDGVIALINDIEAIGMLVEDRRTESDYFAKTETTTYFNKVDAQYYNDLSENGVVFILSDNPPTQG